MGVRSTIMTVSWLRRLWRFLPGPLRIPVLIIGLLVWLSRRGDDGAGAEHADGSA